jgi:hypothetical protein
MNAEQNKSNDLTPEQLLVLMDLQIEAQRAKRASMPQRGGMFVAAGILFIIFATVASLIVLSNLLPSVKPSKSDSGRPQELENSQ